ncbi:PIN domain-containing protein [Paracoccus beibuensis]|uniref:PIN domain-containing protein n=1 Tax=Paracoccus beibuensis TaxID=547602 RepID=UPI00223F17F0|nr:PIN domain-containing protein [Paracoccus beibuensis]
MFVDSSAFLAILGNTADAALLVEKIKGSRRQCKTSASVRLDVVMALAESRADTRGVSAEGIELATEIFDSLLQVLNVYEVAISPRIAADGCRLAARFGKLTDHTAQLPTETCLSLAAAESLRLPVLHCNLAIDQITEKEWAAWRAGD